MAPPHPEPPVDLDKRELPLVSTYSVPPWYRHHRIARQALHFGTAAAGRFNAPAGEFGVLYLATDPFGAFVETFGRITGDNIVPTEQLRQGCLCRVDAHRPMALVDLTGPGLARIGADARLCTGEHALARRWALALWSHPRQPDGLYYRSRLDPERSCLALFEDRAGAAVSATHQGSLLQHPHLLSEILDHYQFALI